MTEQEICDFIDRIERIWNAYPDNTIIVVKEGLMLPRQVRDGKFNCAIVPESVCEDCLIRKMAKVSALECRNESIGRRVMAIENHQDMLFEIGKLLYHR